MEFSFPYVKSLIVKSFQDPRSAMAEVVSLQLPRQTLWLLFALACAASVILSYVTGFFLPRPDLPEGTLVFEPSPFFLFGLLLASQGVLLFLGTVVAGRMAGGQGSFDDVLSLVIFQQVILFALNVIQLIIALIIPDGAALFGIGAMIIMVWQLCHFMAQIHGFKSAVFVFMGGVASIFVISIVLSIVLISLGILPLEGL